MHSRRTATRTALAFTTILMVAPGAAFAQFGAIQRTLFRGLELAGDFSLLSNPQNGPFFNDNIFAQRLETNLAGDGYTYEQWRFFGEDSFGNPTTLDLGPLKFNLGLDPNLINNAQPIGLHTRAGYTTRFIPEIFFQQETAQRFTNIFAGTSAVQAAPLRYNITLNTGAQDFTWFGNILLDTSGRINALGFYDFDFRLTNVGTYTADGILIVDEETTDFEIGPINTSGHIVLDALAMLLQGTGQAAGAVPLRVASGGAQKDIVIDEIIARANAGEELTEDEVRALVNHVLVASLFGDPLTSLLGGIPANQILGDGLSVSFTQLDPEEAGLIVNSVPEPGTLGLLAFALAASGLARYSSRRRRHA